MNRDTCKKCKLKEAALGWGVHSYDAWERQGIFCPVADETLCRVGKKSKSPPRDCPHKFEHAVGDGIDAE
jgi:hypothetical protein